MTTVATAGELVKPSRSHWITLDWQQHHGHGQGFGPIREEVHPVAEATWRGKRYRVELEADRYLHSSGWSDWRIFARRCFELLADDAGIGYAPEGRPGTETATRALGDVCAPLVLEWLESDDYTASRRRELARGIAREIKDAAGSTYNLDRARGALEKVGEELNPCTAITLRRLIGVAQELADELELLSRSEV